VENIAQQNKYFGCVEFINLPIEVRNPEQCNNILILKMPEVHRKRLKSNFFPDFT
jgi:hypothetical protein